MRIRVLQLVESGKPQAGAITASLYGQRDALSAYEIDTRMISANGSARDTTEPLEWRRALEDTDALHVFGWGYPLARQAVAAARKLGKPYVVSPLGALCENRYERPALSGRWRRLFHRKGLIRDARAVTVMNEREGRELRARAVACNIVDLSCGLAVDAFDRQDTRDVLRSELPAGRIVLALSPIHPAEGYVPFLKAFAELGTKTDGWTIVIAGPTVGHWRTMLEAAVTRKGGTGRVFFTEAADTATQRALLDRAWMLAAPSLYVRCPVSILQAMAVGVPVLATHLVAPTGLSELLHVCAPTKAEFKSALSALLSLSDAARAELSRRCRATCREWFDWSVVGKRYAELYQNLATKSAV